MNYWEGMTITQMCDVVAYAEILADNSGNPATADQTLNYSPTGELFEIPFWYLEALVVLGVATESDIESHFKDAEEKDKQYFEQNNK